MNPTIARLRDAVNRHDLDAMAALFAPDYRSEQPVHPNRGFGGPEQVVANWSAMFRGVPDLQVDVVTETTAASECWAEWVWHGTHGDGSPFLMKGVTVMGLDDDGLISRARLFMEPVEQDSVPIDDAVRQLSGSA
jgi:ketosteroid isomerase-like protein